MSASTVTELSVDAGGRSVGTRADDPVVKIIARSPVFVAIDATLGQATRLLTEESIGALLVSAPHGPAGLLSERDIVAAVAEGARPERDRVRDYMTADLETVPETATIAEARDRMLANEIRHLVVMKGEATIGLISIRDILAALS